MPVIRVGVQAPQGSEGQVVDLDGPRASIASIANVSAVSIAYSLDGGSTWTTLAAGASGGSGVIDAGMLRLRKVASTGAYPATVDVDATIYGLADPSFTPSQTAALQGVVSDAGKLAPFPRRSTITTRGMATFVNAGTANAAPGWTSHIRVAADADFTHVRLLIPNIEAAAITLCTAIVAATANSTSKITPTGAWATVTVGGSATFTLPARVSASEPSYTVSDWIRLDSIARDDGGTLPLAMARLFIPQASNATFSATGGLSAGFDALYPDALAWQTRQQVDGVTTPANLTSTGEGTTVAFHSLQFRSAVANVNILGLGDSITSGFAATVQQDNWGWRAVNALRAAGARVSWLNGGVNGQATATYLARGKALAAAVSPQVVVYSAFSPNDGTPNASVIATMWANVLDFLDWASANRYVPVVTTPCPWDSLTAPQDAFRVTLRDRVLGLRELGVDVIDFDAVLSNQASPARFIAGLGDGDKHPITAGQAAMATAAQAVFAAILARQSS